MSYNIQDQLELRNFDSVSEFLYRLPQHHRRAAIVQMMQTHNVVMWDRQIPEDVKTEILSGIETICAEYEYVVNDVQALVDRELVQRDMNPGLAYREYRQAIESYKMIYDNITRKYAKGEISLMECVDVFVSFGELERNLNAMKYNHGIEEDYSF